MQINLLSLCFSCYPFAFYTFFDEDYFFRSFFDLFILFGDIYLISSKGRNGIAISYRFYCAYKNYSTLDTHFRVNVYQRVQLSGYVGARIYNDTTSAITIWLFIKLNDGQQYQRRVLGGERSH